jgi:protein involved in polysaccharide export with SLBB domain
MRFALAAAACIVLTLTPSISTAQLTTTQINRFIFSKEDVEQMLVQAGASQATAMKMLERYPSDYRFAEDEVRELLLSIPQEELMEEYRTRQAEGVEREEGKETVPLMRGTSRKPPLPGVRVRLAKEGEVLPFGYDVFAMSPLEYEPTEDVAVGPDYVLGRGDEVFVTLWGAVEKSYTVVINREGNVVLPELGVVHAAGSTLAAFETFLKRRFSGVYSDFSMDVSLGRLRTIQVFVVGDVVRPGAYTISPVSTVFNALYYAGGPSERGSLRRVLVYRSGDLIANVDLYDYLLRGDSGNDIRLRSGDTIYVTTIGPTAAVQGEVKRPAIYELRGGETVGDVVELAGGLTAESYTERIDVIRVLPDSGLTSVVASLSQEASPDSAGEAADIPVQDGDVITVYSVWHVHPKEYVAIEGMVQRPGKQLLFPGMRVSDLIFRAGGLLDQAYLLHAELSRIVKEPEKTGLVSDLIFIRIEDIMKVPDSGQNVILESGDKVYIRKIPGWKLQDQVKVEGEVRFPGTYALRTKEEKLSQVIQRAGGMTIEAFPKAGTVHRKDEGRVIVDIFKALDKPGGSDDLTMVDGDSVYIPIYPNTIKVLGAVGRPGSIIFSQGKSANYYIEKTGGFLEEANKGSVRIVRLDGSTEKARKRFWFDPQVEPGNRIIVELEPKGRAIDWRGAIRDSTAIIASMATTIYIISQIN